MFIAIGIFFVFLLLGMPVAFSIGLSGFSFFMIRDLPMTVLVQKSISTSQSFTMLAIPLFILAGNLMNSCGIPKRLMRFANACTGHMYGNIGLLPDVHPDGRRLRFCGCRCFDGVPHPRT
mgnify:CR=1 FL=1